MNELPDEHLKSRGRRKEKDFDEMDDELSLQEKEYAEQAIKISNFLKLVGDDSDARIEIKKKSLSNNKYQYLCVKPIMQFDMEALAQEYGGGDYQLVIKSGEGKYIKATMASISSERKPTPISEKISSSTDLDKLPAIMEMFANKIAPKNDDQILQLMADRSDKFMAMMMTSMQENGKMMITMMTGMMQAMATMGGGKQDSSSAMLAPILTMLMEHSLKKENNNLDAMLNAMVRIRDIAKDDDKPGLMDKMLESAPALLAAVAGSLQKKQLIPQIQNQPSFQPATVVTPAPQTAVQPPQADQAMMIIEMLIDMATKNMPVAEAYDLLTRDMTQSQFEQTAVFFESENWFDQLNQFDLRFKNFKPWFEKLREEFLKEDEEEKNEHSNETDPNHK